MAIKSTQLPSGRWRGRFRHPVTRKVIQATKDEQGNRFDYEYEADAWALVAEERAKRAAAGETPEVAVERAAQALGTVPAAPKWVGPKIGEHGRILLDRKAGGWQRSTRAWYDRHLTGLAVQVHPDRAPIADVPAGLLKFADVEQWVTDQKLGHPKVAERAGNPTINHRLALLRMILGDLVRDDDNPLQRNVADGIKFLPEDQSPDRILTRAEDAALLAAASPQLQVAALCALDAGLRWQEVYALRKSSVVTFDGGPFLVVSHVVERGTKELRPYPKGKRSRVVPTTERLAAALAPLVEEAPHADALLFPTPGRADRPQTADAFRPWDYNNFRARQWGPAMVAAGFAREVAVPTGKIRKYTTAEGNAGEEIVRRKVVDAEFGFHSLRHTYGSRLAAAGRARSLIAELMGHADETTTARYIHLGDDGDRLRLVRAALTPVA